MRLVTTIINSLLFVFLLIPDTVSAQGIFGGVCSGTTCSACHIATLANTFISWLIGAVMVLFAVLMINAGFRLVTSQGNPAALSDAKDKFVNAIVGLIIVLSAWLIVDTLMRGLVGNNGQVTGYGPWSQIQCTTQTESTVKEGEVEIIRAEVETSSAIAPIADGTCPSTYMLDARTSTCVYMLPPVPEGQVGSNCGVDESALVAIPGQGGHRAMSTVVSRFSVMERQLAASGITLSVTSSYRSDARQTELWDQCPRCQNEGTVARPCSRGGNGSAHTSGLALDLSSSGERCDVIRACRSAGASFIMTYSRTGHVHCDWRGGNRGESLTTSCPR